MSTPEPIAQFIPLNKIDFSKTNPRSKYDDEKLKEMAGSIKTNGVLQPILVRPLGKRFELIAGERRTRAARMAGLVEIPAVVRDGTAAQILEWQIIENDQREDISPLDRANSYLRLKEELDYDVKEIAEHVGKAEVTVFQYLTLTKLPDNAKRALAEGQITKAIALRIATLSEEWQQREATEDLASPDGRVSDQEAKRYLERKFGVTAKRGVSKKKVAAAAEAARDNQQYIANWKYFLVRFSAEQFLKFQKIVKGRVETSVLSEAVDIVMREERKAKVASNAKGN